MMLLHLMLSIILALASENAHLAAMHDAVLIQGSAPEGPC